MRRPSAALILIFSLFMAVLVIAGPSEDATQAYDRGDYETAYRLNKSLAERRSPVAQSNLGLMYYHSRGVSQDYVLAYMWLNLASTRDSAWEKEKRDKAEENRKNLASKLSPAQIAEAQKLAREWKLKKEK